MKSFESNPVLKLGPTTAGQLLYFFGASHTNDPTDKQFNQLKKLWTEFLTATKKGRTVFVEGATREMPQNYEEAIHQYGEAGAIQWLAREANVDMIRPEPTDEEQRRLLCASFDPSIVAYTVIMQNLAGWFRHKSQISFDEAVNRVLKREVNFSDIYGFVPDRPWLDSQHKKLFGEQKLEDKQFLDSISDPRKNDTIINEAIALRSKLRDEHILSVITEVWRSGKSIFIVYGKGHLVALKNQLQELTNY